MRSVLAMCSQDRAGSEEQRITGMMLPCNNDNDNAVASCSPSWPSRSMPMSMSLPMPLPKHLPQPVDD